MNNYEEQDWPDFVQHLRKSVESQYKEVKKAVVGIGEYTFEKEFESFAVPMRRWNQLSKEQQTKHLKKVLAIQMDQFTTIESDEIANEVPPLSVNLHMCNINNMPKTTLPAIFKKASSLCNTAGSIQPAPGNNSKAKMIASSRKCPPHFVRGYPSGKYECDSACPQWSSAKVCSHTVAAAECNQELKKFMKWCEKNEKQPDMMALVTRSVTNSGRKEGSRKRKHRANTEVTTDVVVQRIPSTSNHPSTSSYPSTSNNPSTSNLPRANHLPSTSHLNNNNTSDHARNIWRPIPFSPVRNQNLEGSSRPTMNEHHDNYFFITLLNIDRRIQRCQGIKFP